MEVVACIMARCKRIDECIIEYATALRLIGNGVAINKTWYVTAFANGVDD